MVSLAYWQAVHRGLAASGYSLPAWPGGKSVFEDDMLVAVLHQAPATPAGKKKPAGGHYLTVVFDLVRGLLLWVWSMRAVGGAGFCVCFGLLLGFNLFLFNIICCAKGNLTR